MVWTAFSTAAAFGLVLTISFVIGIEALNAVDYYNQKVDDAATVRSDILDEQIHTSIEITSITRPTDEDYKISILNKGSTTLDPDYVYVATNASWIDDATHDMSGEYWEPEETLNLTYTATNQTLVFKVMVENGVMDVYDYTV